MGIELATWFLRQRVAETDIRNAAHKAADRTQQSQVIVFLDGTGRPDEIIEPNLASVHVADATQARAQIRQNLQEILDEHGD